jgi:hypothetical protein
MLIDNLMFIMSLKPRIYFMFNADLCWSYFKLQIEIFIAAVVHEHILIFELNDYNNEFILILKIGTNESNCYFGWEMFYVLFYLLSCYAFLCS